MHREDAGRGPSLLLAPASLLDNWENEFKKWAPALKVYCHRGKADTRLEALDAKVRQLGSLDCIVLYCIGFLHFPSNRALCACAMGNSYARNHCRFLC